MLLHSRDPFMPPPCRMLMSRMLSQCPAWRVGAKMESEERGARSEDWGAGSGKEIHRRYIHGEGKKRSRCRGGCSSTILTKSLSFSSGMTPPSKRNVRNGQGKDGGGRKRSRGSGSVSLQDNLFNPEGIFRQILQSDSWKEVKKDMDRRRVEREEEEARRNATAREAEQQRQQQHGKEPKIMTLDAWKRQALFEKGCTRKEARGLVRVANNAREIGGTLTFSKKLLTDVPPAKRRKLPRILAAAVRQGNPRWLARALGLAKKQHIPLLLMCRSLTWTWTLT